MHTSESEEEAEVGHASLSKFAGGGHMPNHDKDQFGLPQIHDMGSQRGQRLNSLHC